MPILVTCPCGRASQFGDFLAGLPVKCLDCGTTLALPRPGEKQPKKLAERPSFNPGEEAPLLRHEQPASRQFFVPGETVSVSPPRNLPSTPLPETISPKPLTLPATPPPSRPLGTAATLEPLPYPDVSDRRGIFDRGWLLALNKRTIRGLVIMGVALVWFAFGLMNGLLFYYPPVMFIMGALTFLWGALERD